MLTLFADNIKILEILNNALRKQFEEDQPSIEEIVSRESSEEIISTARLEKVGAGRTERKASDLENVMLEPEIDPREASLDPIKATELEDAQTSRDH